MKRDFIPSYRIQTIEKRAAGLCCSFLYARDYAFEKNLLTKSNPETGVYAVRRKTIRAPIYQEALLLIDGIQEVRL